MWNKKEMSQLDVTLTRVPLTLTSDLDLDDLCLNRPFENLQKITACLDVMHKATPNIEQSFQCTESNWWVDEYHMI